MHLLSRYTGRVVLGAILLVLLVILALNVIGALADGLGDLRNDYDFPELLLYVGATLPERAYESLPFAVLIEARDPAAVKAVRDAHAAAMETLKPHFKPGVVAATPYTEVSFADRRRMADASNRFRDAIANASRVVGADSEIS